jgi:hypothetical protein
MENVGQAVLLPLNSHFIYLFTALDSKKAQYNNVYSLTNFSSGHIRSLPRLGFVSHENYLQILTWPLRELAFHRLLFC